MWKINTVYKSFILEFHLLNSSFYPAHLIEFVVSFKGCTFQIPYKPSCWSNWWNGPCFSKGTSTSAPHNKWWQIEKFRSHPLPYGWFRWQQVSILIGNGWVGHQFCWRMEGLGRSSVVFMSRVGGKSVESVRVLDK